MVAIHFSNICVISKTKELQAQTLCFTSPIRSIKHKRGWVSQQVLAGMSKRLQTNNNFKRMLENFFIKLKKQTCTRLGKGGEVVTSSLKQEAMGVTGDMLSPAGLPTLLISFCVLQSLFAPRIWVLTCHVLRFNSVRWIWRSGSLQLICVSIWWEQLWWEQIRGVAHPHQKVKSNCISLAVQFACGFTFFFFFCVLRQTKTTFLCKRLLLWVLMLLCLPLPLLCFSRVVVTFKVSSLHSFQLIAHKRKHHRMSSYTCSCFTLKATSEEIFTWQ